MNLLKPLIPSWRFFDQVGDQTRLWVRTRIKNEIFGAWTLCLQKPKRRPMNLFLNAKGNLYLAEQAAVDRLAQELETAKDIENSISFRIVKQIALEFVAGTAAPRPILKYQFRIEVLGSENYDALISQEYEA